MARAFQCTGCGDCCRDLGGLALPAPPPAGPVVRLADRTGLPLLSWEAHRLLRLAGERHTTLDLLAFDAVLDLTGERAVVLSYRLRGQACAFFAPRADLPVGPLGRDQGHDAGGVCGIYDERPLVCRAFPLVGLRNGEAVVSRTCPEALPLSDAADAWGAAEAVERAYPGWGPWMRALRGAPRLAVEVVARLEAMGVVRVAARPEAWLPGAFAWPRVDLCDLAAAHGVAAWEALEAAARAPGEGDASGPPA